MKISRTKFKEQIRIAKQRQQEKDVAKFTKEENSIRTFYENEIKKIRQTHREELESLNNEYTAELKRVATKRMLKYKDKFESISNDYNNLRTTYLATKNKLKDYEEALREMDNMRIRMNGVLQRFGDYQNTIMNATTSITQPLLRMQDELEIEVTRLKNKQSKIDKLLYDNKELHDCDLKLVENEY